MAISNEAIRRSQIERCKKLLENGKASLEHVLGEAWDYGFIAGDKDTDVVDLEMDARVDEINREREAIESGCVEPPALGWLPRRAS